MRKKSFVRELAFPAGRKKTKRRFFWKLEKNKKSHNEAMKEYLLRLISGKLRRWRDLGV